MKKQMTKILLAMGLTVAAGSAFAQNLLPSISCTAASPQKLSCKGVPANFTVGFGGTAETGTYVLNKAQSPSFMANSQSSATGNVLTVYYKNISGSGSMWLETTTAAINVAKTVTPNSGWTWQGFEYSCSPVNPAACAFVFE